MAVCPAQHPTLSRLSTVEYFSEYLLFNTRASRASIHLHTMKVVTILIPSFHGTPGSMAYRLRRKHEKKKKKKKNKRLHFSSLALRQQARLISRRDCENNGVLADVLSRAVSFPNSLPLPFRTWQAGYMNFGTTVVLSGRKKDVGNWSWSLIGM